MSATYTYALLDVSFRAYDEIAAKLRAADYGHAFDDGKIDMHGIALVRSEEKEMANVYEGQPDGRQSAERIPVSRFRPMYRALSDEEKALHDELKGKASELEDLFGRVKDGRYKALAFTSLEQSIMWIVKELTS